MAYKPEELEAQALAAIQEHKLYFIEHIIPYLPCDKKTFYNLGLHEFPAIKSSIEYNKIAIKTKQLNKWADSENATLQLAHYKLVADDEERKKLSQQYTDITTKGDKLEAPTVVGSDVLEAFITQVKTNVDNQARSNS